MYLFTSTWLPLLSWKPSQLLSCLWHCKTFAAIFLPRLNHVPNTSFMPALSSPQFFAILHICRFPNSHTVPWPKCLGSMKDWFSVCAGMWPTQPPLSRSHFPRHVATCSVCLFTAFELHSLILTRSQWRKRHMRPKKPILSTLFFVVGKTTAFPALPQGTLPSTAHQKVQGSPPKCLPNCAATDVCQPSLSPAHHVRVPTPGMATKFQILCTPNICQQHQRMFCKLPDVSMYQLFLKNNHHIPALRKRCTKGRFVSLKPYYISKPKQEWVYLYLLPVCTVSSFCNPPFCFFL